MRPAQVDAAHLARAANGDREAFGEVIREHYRWVSGIALAELRDRAASEDVAQDVFLAAWRGLARLRNPGSFHPWLRELTRNHARLRLRERVRTPSADPEPVLHAEVDPRAGADERLAEAERARALWRAFEELPLELREVLTLYYREERSSAQVAALLELSDMAVRKRLSRAREQLRVALGDEDRELGALLDRPRVEDARVRQLVLSLPVLNAVAGAGVGTAAGASAAKGSLVAAGLGGAAGGLAGGLLGTYLRIRWELQRSNSPEDVRRLRTLGWLMVATCVGLAVGFAGLVALPGRRYTFPAFSVIAVAWIAVLKFVWLERITAERNAREREADPDAAARQRRGLWQRRVVFALAGGVLLAAAFLAAWSGVLD